MNRHRLSKPSRTLEIVFHEVRVAQGGGLKMHHGHLAGGPSEKNSVRARAARLEKRGGANGSSRGLKFPAVHGMFWVKMRCEHETPVDHR